MGVRKIRGNWWVDVRFRGNRYRLRSPDNHKESAIAYELVIRKKLSANEPVYLSSDPRSKIRPPSEERFGKFVPEWFETYVKTYLKPSTQRKYGHAIKLYLLPRFSGSPLAAITSNGIKEFTGHLLRCGLKPKTVNGILSVLRRCLDVAVEWERLERTPRFHWLKSDPPAYDFLSSSESKRLLQAAAEQPYALMIRMALRTGMRIGELLAVRWEDIDFEQRLIAVRHSIVRGVESSPKTRRHRYIPISMDLYKDLTVARRTAGYVFSVGNRGILPLREPRKGLWRALQAAGLRRVGWHVLRHTFASQLVSEGISIYLIQALLGHSTVQMTARYAHLAPSATRGVVDVLEAAEDRAVDSLGQPMGTLGRTGSEQRHVLGLETSSTSAVPSKRVHLAVNSLAGAVGET